MAAKPALSSTTGVKNSQEDEPEFVTRTLLFLKRVGMIDPLAEGCNSKGFYSQFIRSFLQVDEIQRGRITCNLAVKPPITNFFKSLHGGALAAVVELVAIACAKTVVTEDKEIFLGEMSVSYLSGAPTNAEVLIDGSVVRSGRNLTVVALEFKLKKTGKLAYTARVTFYNMPVAKL
ncbi:hypothetical protein L6164_021080 [Bauhinia variegata]|uniref:Uncharacterized protein n=1 Tax=Bauhinia variegata TaxID=167791 RepID=A0ACB9MXC0_BAUVA|nr:hypothetical protein L6164_021080 [Bauhinia variegata]